LPSATGTCTASRQNAIFSLAESVPAAPCPDDPEIQDGHGRPLARGVYLYAMTVRGSDGEIAKRTVQKLIVND